jgi:hypothetical protein
MTQTIGADVNSGTQNNYPSDHSVSYPASLKSPWVNVLDAGALLAADNAGGKIVNPITQPGASGAGDHHDLVVGPATLVEVRMGYDAATTAAPSTAPVVQIFGFDQGGSPAPRGSATGNWEELYADSTNPASGPVTLAATPATDLTDGTLNYTPWQRLDANGCRRLRFAVMAALVVAGSGGGNGALAILQARLV